MSRVFAYTAILLLFLVFVIAGGHLARKESETENGTPEDGAPELDRGNSYRYQQATLARFGKLLESEDWTLADPARNPQGMQETVHVKTGLTFVLIPAGSFLMGSPENENGRDDDEGPIHTVTVPAFLLCETECTQRAWEKCGGAPKRSIFEPENPENAVDNPSRFKGAELPVTEVSWTRSQACCARIGLRLPSESEWEYACRAGTKTPFSTGRILSTDQANYNGNYPCGGGKKGENREQPVAAGSLPPNPWGLYEMHGNVCEWCEDTWHDSYEGAPTDGSAWTTGGWLTRVHRGGSFIGFARRSRSAHRRAYDHGYFLGDLGFRPAADLPE